MDHLSVSDLEKTLTEKPQNKEKNLLSLVMKATARQQEYASLISKLKREREDYLDSITLLEAEADMKAELIREKREEAERLKAKNEKLKILMKQRHQLYKSPKVARSYSMRVNNNNYKSTSDKAVDNVTLLEAKVQMKAELIRKKCEETEQLKAENEKLKTLLKQRQYTSPSRVARRYSLHVNNNNFQPTVATTSAEAVAIAAKPRAKVKRSFKKTERPLSNLFQTRRDFRKREKKESKEE